jgi:TPP-dependent pyruvate/acetoin dehydrogenase alpha subunit
LKAAKIPAVEIPWENPLIPNKRLRQLYTAMAELRLLEEHIVALQRRARPASRLRLSPGEEAIRVSTALSLLPGDLTSDAAPGIATRFLRGAKLADIVHAAYLSVSKSKPAPTELPLAEDAAARLHIALGASLASQKKGRLVLAHVYPGELTTSEWKSLFRIAANCFAPVLFVALPASAATPGRLSELSTASGVPGIPIDAADAVGLYRVVQESMLRIRAGGGPVLMECIPFRLPGKKMPPSDPVLNMRASLTHRKIADDAWFLSVATRFASRLRAADV